MRLRTFRAATMTEALDHVRKEMGVDAVIVSSQQDSMGFQITAALETPAPDVTPAYKSKNQEAYSSIQLIELLCRWFEYHMIPDEIAESLLSQLKILTEDQGHGLYNIDSIISKLLPHQPIDYTVPDMIADDH